MAVFDMPRPRFTAEDMDDEKQRKKIVSWLVQLDEKLRYMLENIDEENLSVQMGEQIRLIAQGVEDSKAVIEVLPDQVRIAVSTLQEEIDGLEFDEFETAGSEIVLKATEARISTPLFVVDITNTETGTALRIDRDGAVMDYLTVNEELHAPNVVERYTGPTTITLAQGDSIQAALNTINGKLLSDNVTIDLSQTAAGTYFIEHLTMRDILGGGTVTIVGGDGQTGNRFLYGGVYINGCSCRVNINYLTMVGIDTRTAYVVGMAKSGFVLLWHCVVDSSNLTNVTGAVAVVEGTVCYLDNTTLYGDTGTGSGPLIRVGSGAEAQTKDISGVGEKFLSAEYAKVIMTGTRPQGTYEEIVSGSVLKLPSNPASLTADAGSYTPAVPQYAETTEIEAERVATWVEGVWEDALTQGYERYYDQGWIAHTYYGIMWFNRDVLENLVRTIQQVTLKLKVSMGPSYPVSVWAYPVAREYKESPGEGYTPWNYVIKKSQTQTVVGGLIGKVNVSEYTELADAKLAEIVDVLAAYAQMSGDNKKNFGILLYTGESTASSSTHHSANWAMFEGADSDYPPCLTVTFIPTT